MTIDTVMGKEKDENVRQRFGKYFILDHLVEGGMAKIYRARFLGEEADKIIAIKMIKAQFSSDDNFKKMFLDELNVIFGFEHPNVINTFDYGMNKGQLYVAMEYCDGRSVNEYINKLKKKNCHIPIDVTLSIVSQICRGLHYVHKFRDKLTGKKKDIIHRDISPHNIMLGYEGAVKVIDFGIAKVNADSKVNSDATQSGTIKGKISYLAPEYIEGVELDHRYDQFATGITLWEMLCGRKLFEASNNMAVLKKIQQCKVEPPSTINPNVPKELDEIVMKSLSRERDDRYENMDQFDRALTKLLNTHYPDFHNSDVGYFAESLFKAEIERDREKLFEFGKIDIKPYIEELRKEGKKGGRTSPSLDGITSPTATKTKRSIAIFDFEESNGSKKKYIKADDAYDDTLFTSASFENVSLKIKRAIAEKRKGKDIEDKERNRRNDRTGFRKSKRKHEWQKIKRVQVGKDGMKGGQSEPDDSAQNSKPAYEWQKTKNRPSVSNDPIQKLVASVVIVIACLISWKMFQKKDVDTVVNKNESTAREAASEEAQATLSLENFNRFEQKLFVNGQETEVSLYSNASLDAGENIFIRIEAKNKHPYVARFSLSPGERKKLSIPVQKSGEFAKLRAFGNCPKGTLHFSLYGEKRVIPIPFGGLYSFPLRGDGIARVSERGMAVYKLTFRGENGSEKRLAVEFQSAKKPINLCNKL